MDEATLFKLVETAHRTLMAMPDSELEQLAPPTVPLVPSPRQQEFLDLECEEALYGGAAGGGKSEALLMWLAEGIEIRDYAGLALRRTFPQLDKADGLIAKSRRLYQSLGGVYSESKKRWTFPSGARIEFGHLQHEKSVEDYYGPAYHRIAWDELTQFSEKMYTTLFSRVGRVELPIRPGVRAASNPGGLGHKWVRDRFVTREAMDLISSLKPHQKSPPGVFWSNANRAFVPARVADNPGITLESYVARMDANLDPVTKARLVNGDWRVVEGGVIKPHWIRWWRRHGGEYYHLLDRDARTFRTVHESECSRFVIVDCAATSEEVKRREQQKPPSYSAVSTFDVLPSSEFIWLRVTRGLWDFPTLIDATVAEIERAQPIWTGVEDEKTGRALWQMLRQRGYNMRPLKTEGKGKLERAAAMLNRMKEGQFYLEEGADWSAEAMDEFEVWTGHPDETADIIDTGAYMAREWQREPMGTIVIEGVMHGRV